MRTIDERTRARARRALHKAAGQLLFEPNVTLIDFGYPEHGGHIATDEEPEIRVHLVRKFPVTMVETAVQQGLTPNIPSKIDEFNVDIPQGVYRPQQWWWNWWSPPRTNLRTQRRNPMQGGISISDGRRYTYGTLGGAVRDRSTGELMILSNWHVLAGNWHARRGLATLQPGRLDGGQMADQVAQLERDAMKSGLDAAVATLSGQRDLINDQLELGPVTGLGQVRLGMHVIKSGRRTQVTTGRVTAVDGMARLTYAGVPRVIRKVITIEPHNLGEQVSAPGDSGSFWLESETSAAVGLHFAGGNTPERALAIDMGAVLDALDVDLITQPTRRRTTMTHRPQRVFA